MTNEALEARTTKLDIVKNLATRYPNLFNKDAQEIVDLMFDEMSEALASGDRIEIRGFGTFTVKHRAPRTARNPKTNETVMLDERFSPYFRAGKELKERLNAN